MKTHRFIIDALISSGVMKIEDARIVHQIKDVLRLKVTNKIIIADGKLHEANAHLIEIGKNFVILKADEIRENENEPSVEVILYCAILKRDNFELAVQKATEIGIKEIVPIITKRTVKLNLKQKRLELIIKEAAEQSGRGVVPLLRPMINFTQACQNAKQNDVNLFFDLSGKKFDGAKLKKLKSKRVGIFIGPEGGWDESEIELAKQNNFIIASLGKLTLRAETAAIVASHITLNF